MPRVRAERDPNRFARPNADGDPKVIDVRGDTIEFRGESDGRSGEVDEIAVITRKGGAFGEVAAAMRQAFKALKKE